MQLKRWMGVVVLMIVVSIAYVDRINVSLMITNADFLKAFGLEGDRLAQGRLVSLFLFGYGLSAWFLTPVFEARWTVRTGLLVSLLFWTIFTGASAVTAGITLFLFWLIYIHPAAATSELMRFSTSRRYPPTLENPSPAPLRAPGA